MKKTSIFRFTCIFTLISFSLFGVNPSNQNITNVVNKLVEYHIDTHEIHGDVLAKSLSSYINTFDPIKSYLLKKEIVAYLNPTESYKKSLFENYKNTNFSDYKKLNEVIKISIPRARNWRETWIKNPEKLFNEALNIKSCSSKSEFTDDLVLLEKKHKDYFLSIISSYIKDSPKNKYIGKEEALLNLCNKFIKSHENDYLCIQDNGKPMNEEQENRHISIKIIKSIANSLDAHTAYFSDSEASFIRAQLEKGMCGIGIILKEDIEGIIIKDVIPGGPADESKKILPNDVLTTVNGQTIKNMTFSKVLEILKGSEGSKVSLGLERSSATKKIEVTVTRNKIVIGDKRVDVSSEPFGNGVIGKVTLHSFYEGENHISSEDDLKKAISELKQENMLGLVLDMRENSGGFLSQAVKVSGLFMSNGVVVISRYADGSTKFYRTLNGKKFYDGPLVILVSKSTASASEIVAQTLQDYGLAIVVGDEQTYGKGTIQHQTITGNQKLDPLFKVTVGRYYTVSGKSTQIEGVKSDIFVPSKYSEEEIGERYLDNPLIPDSCPPAFEDNLADVSPSSRKWLQKYYIPSLQIPENEWREFLPQLMNNSKKRIEKNTNYQKFRETLKQASEEQKTTSDNSFGANDLQMDESVNIVKDIILLSKSKEKKKALVP